MRKQRKGYRGIETQNQRETQRRSVREKHRLWEKRERETEAWKHRAKEKQRRRRRVREIHGQ